VFLYECIFKKAEEAILEENEREDEAAEEHDALEEGLVGKEAVTVD